MFTTSDKVVEGTLYACQLSIRLNRLSSTAAFNGLIFNAAELPLLTHYVFFFPIGFYIVSHQCFSSSILELLTIPVSAILPLFLLSFTSFFCFFCTAPFHVLSHNPFSQVGSFHRSLSQSYTAGPHQSF